MKLQEVLLSLDLKGALLVYLMENLFLLHEFYFIILLTLIINFHEDFLIQEEIFSRRLNFSTS